MSDSQEVAGDGWFWVGAVMAVMLLGGAAILASRGFQLSALAVAIPGITFLLAATVSASVAMGGIVREKIVIPAMRVIRA